MIEVSDIIKQFGTVHALKGVSFGAEEGDVVGLLGPNGAGKTTIIRILSSFFPPTSGVARVCGLDVIQDSLEIRRRIGYFIESVPLYSEMRVSAFLNFAAEAKKVGKRHKKDAVTEVLELCGLEHVKDRIIKNLSKGYRQRVGLAQALINRPEVLILDEPTIGIDPEQVYEIRNLIKSLSEKSTVIISSHILSEVDMLANKIIVMDKGLVIAEDTPENLRSLLQDRQITNVRIEGPPDLVLERLERMPGVCDVSRNEEISDSIFRYRIESEEKTDVSREICTLAFEHNWVLRGMESVKLNLEEVFLRLITKEKEH